jgi:glycosyltransferase involved in cell wall biosynthesis
MTHRRAMTAPSGGSARIHIVRIVTRLNIGGPAIHVALLTKSLDPARFSSCLVIGRPDATEGDLRDLLDGVRATILDLPSLQRRLHPIADLWTLARLARILWRQRPDLIHTHMAKAGTLGRLAGLLYNGIGPGRRRRARLIHTFHGHVLDGYFSSASNRLFTAIERWLARRTDRLIAVSDTVRRDLLALGIGRPAQWTVIPVGLDLALLAQLPLPNGAPRVRFGLVGRLVPIKNPNLFVEALGRTAQAAEAPAVQGVIVGDGPLRQTVEHETRRLGLDGLIRFDGWQRDLPGVYQRLEVACLTSWNEGTPVAMIEAMAAGRAVVATTVGGVQDVLADGRAPVIAPGAFATTDRGLLIRPGDAEGLAAAMGVLARDPALRARLGQAARAHVLERFTDRRLVRDIQDLYGRLTGQLTEPAEHAEQAGEPCMR